MLRRLLTTDGLIRLWSRLDGDLARGEEEEEEGEEMLYLCRGMLSLLLSYTAPGLGTGYSIICVTGYSIITWPPGAPGSHFGSGGRSESGTAPRSDLRESSLLKEIYIKER